MSRSPMLRKPPVAVAPSERALAEIQPGIYDAQKDRDPVRELVRETGGATGTAMAALQKSIATSRGDRARLVSLDRRETLGRDATGIQTHQENDNGKFRAVAGNIVLGDKFTQGGARKTPGVLPPPATSLRNGEEEGEQAGAIEGKPREYGGAGEGCVFVPEQDRRSHWERSKGFGRRGLSFLGSGPSCGR